ncbi:hypothetical protein [Morganella morganii]|uniref:PD-(D/E)XK nuclease domain-containing protein n=1 Tax=Morganella morganii TaxID=582 RepID=UPI003C12C564
MTHCQINQNYKILIFFIYDHEGRIVNLISMENKLECYDNVINIKVTVLPK